MPEAQELLENYTTILEQCQFQELPIANNHALQAGLLTIDHRDPFDRMLMAQAKLEKMAIITYDPIFYLEHLTVIPSPKSDK